MLTKEEFHEMLADSRGNQTGWTDEEIQEFMSVMESDGWVIVR